MVRLLTWNIGGLDDEALDERTEAAIFTAILGARLDQQHAGTKPKAPPDVIVLQEVVTRTLRAHIEPHMGAAGYQIVSSQSSKRASFEVVAYRSPVVLDWFEAVPLVDTMYARELNIARVTVPEGALTILTAHFDSGTDAADIRIAQLQQAAAALGGRGVFAGDANLRKAEWEAVRDRVPMVDAWEELGRPNATRVTWQRNDYSARFDRVFVGRELRAIELRPVGQGVVPGLGMPISDHIGLSVVVQSR